MTSPAASNRPADDSGGRWWQPALWIALATIPLLLPVAWHFLSSATATGFVSYDAPYYMANARSIFERGNGFAYPNPYDPSAAAPVIYFHGLIWVLGFAEKVLRIDPGYLFAGFGVIAALVCSALTFELVKTVLPDRRGRGWLFLLTLWGGGLLCLAGLIVSCWRGHVSLESLFVIDQPKGWWFPNWGRNLLLPTEAAYHALVAFVWLGVLRQRWTWAIGGVAALMATHPFTGLQQLLIVAAWCGFLALRDRTSADVLRVGVLAVLFIAFDWYQFGYLMRFPQHVALVESWSDLWLLSIPFIALASGPVIALAVAQRWRGRWRPSDAELFLVFAGVITLVLMKHDWFIRARQPAHFSRGYNWLPWWLVALPGIQATALRWWDSVPAWRGRLIAAALAAVLVFDNACFIARECAASPQSGYHLSAEQKAMFAWMDRAKLSGVLLCPDPALSYLSATYTAVRPYYGHIVNTPDFSSRTTLVSGWYFGGLTNSWLDAIDYVLIDRRHPPRQYPEPGWTPLHESGDYVLLGRARSLTRS